VDAKIQALAMAVTMAMARFRDVVDENLRTESQLRVVRGGKYRGARDAAVVVTSGDMRLRKCEAGALQLHRAYAVSCVWLDYGRAAVGAAYPVPKCPFSRLVES